MIENSSVNTRPSPPWMNPNDFKAFLREKILTGNHIIPTENSLYNLARSMEYFIQRAHPPSEPIENWEIELANSKLKEASETLRSLIPARRASLNIISNNLTEVGWTHHIDKYNAEIKSLDNLEVALNEAEKSLQPSGLIYGIEVTTWHHLCFGIATTFSAVMQSTNAKRLGISNDGPVARFTAHVMPWITGETPTVGAVAQHLKRMKWR